MTWLLFIYHCESIYHAAILQRFAQDPLQKHWGTVLLDDIRVYVGMIH